ncbi:MAG: hypothetical protein M3Y41_13150 [Pseudomonadota bacterium]|nr:hypothetical protein [Pseudomonadota bacterium]
MRPAEPEAALTVATGAVVAYRLFDICYAIDLGLAEQLWARQARTASTRRRLTTTPPKAVAFGVPPVDLALEPRTFLLGAAPIQAAVRARLFDFGVVSLALHVPASGVGWTDFVALLNGVGRAVGPGSDAQIWAELLREVTALLADALDRPAASTLEEDYLIGVVHAFGGTVDGAEPLGAATLLDRADLVPLLSGEQRPLSAGARADLLRHRFSYYLDDLVVLTWDRAFLYEPRGESDVLDILEVANAQLLEMRYYDELLDAELPRMYDLVETTQRTRSMFGSRRFATLARRLYTLVAEVTELTERVDNALQVTEDVYLARIYAAALDLFRVQTVSAAVERKLAIIRDTYAALYEEASSGRAELMEMAVLVLIAVEVALAVFRH